MNAVILIVLALFGQVSSPGDSPSVAGADPTFDASIRAEHDILLPAEVEGLLTRVAVTEGAQVQIGDVLATIDDRQAQAALEVAQAGYYSADEKAKDTIEQQYAEKAAAVARKDYEMALQANSGGRQVVSQIDVDKKKLDWERARLQIEKAIKDQRLARLDADVKQAELKAAGVALDRRTVTAKFNGEVQHVHAHENEWVNPGDPVMRLVQFDVLHVDCLVPSTEWDPSELQGRTVTVIVTLARNRQATVQGHIIHASQLVVDSTSERRAYMIRAEVKNERQGDFWLVRPGLPARMTVHVSQPPVTIEAAQATPRGDQK